MDHDARITALEQQLAAQQEYITELQCLAGLRENEVTDGLGCDGHFYYGGQRIELTPSQRSVMQVLWRRRGRWVDYVEIDDGISANAVTQRIKRIREAIADCPWVIEISNERARLVL